MGRYKSRISCILLILLVIGIVLGGFSNKAYASDDYDINEGGANLGFEGRENENLLLKVLSGAFRGIAIGIYSFLGEASIDNLVFNKGGALSGLSLFKPGAAQDFLTIFYNVFNYIAIAIFIPIAYWSGLSFAKAGDNPQGKSLLKDRLMKIVLTFAFLYAMPELLTIAVKISNGFVNVFAGVLVKAGFIKGGTGSSGIPVDSLTPVGDYLKRQIDLKDLDIFDGITSLMLMGVNLWMIFYYIIRDLTICFLFMFFPVIAIWFPLNGSMVKGWATNMLGNIIAQPIQAVVLTMVVSLSSAMGASTFLHGVYLIVAFGSIIPMTAIIKGFLGLEGGVGAGSSMAGLGGLMATMTMFRMAKSSFDQNKGLVSEGVKDRLGTSTAEKEKAKNLESGTASSGIRSSSPEGDLERPLINPNMRTVESSATTSEQAFRDEKRTANRKIAKGLGAISMGTFGGMVGASFGAGIGTREAGVLGMAGYGVGTVVGGNSQYVSDATSGVKENLAMNREVRELQYDELKHMDEATYGEMTNVQLESVLNNDEGLNSVTLPIAQEKYLGIYNKELSGTEFQNNERQARLSQRRINNAMHNPVANYAANTSYINQANQRLPMEQIRQMASSPDANIRLYQDQNMSYIYANNSEGQMQVLHTGPGIADMQGTFDAPISFNPSDNMIAQDYAFEYSAMAHADAASYMATAYPEMNDPREQEYKNMYNERYRQTNRSSTMGYENTIKQLRNNYGVQDMSFRTDQIRLQANVERERQIRSAKIDEGRNTTYAKDPSLDMNLGAWAVNINGVQG